MGWIYHIKNKINEKSYIGQTIRPIEKRLEEHETGKNNGCRAIYNAIQKYGWENFDIDWYECSDEDLNKHEKWMVKLMGTLSPGGYNLKEGGGNGKMSEETKQKMSEARSGEKNPMWGKKGDKSPMYGKSHTEETRRKQSEAHLGKTHDDERKQKNREAQLGKTRSKQTKQKHSESTKGENNHKSKRVYQYDLDGSFINSFSSTGEAGRYLNKDSSNIRACACDKTGRRPNAYGYKWSYINY